jgi:hypothetical protein
MILGVEVKLFVNGSVDKRNPNEVREEHNS